METIFVQIASYRDGDLPLTIASCVENAQHPEKLAFGICRQYDEQTYTDLDEFLFDPRFRVHQVYYQASKGCCWARNITNTLYDNEKYTLQVDAHSRFASGWDDRFTDMLASTGDENAVLTTYPPPFTKSGGVETLHNDRGIQRLTLSRFNRDLTTVLGTEQVVAVGKPEKSRFIAAGLIFTFGRFCQDVEYDPELYFAGEEISLAARAYTHGYNFYYPNENLVWHRYRHPMPLHWSDNMDTQTEAHEKAVKRLATLFLGDHTELGRYGLGKKRSLDEFETYAGINFFERANRQGIPTFYSDRIKLRVDDIKSLDDYEFWVFCLLNTDEEELYRSDIHDEAILSKRTAEIEVEAQLTDQPAKYMLWPKSRSEGWGAKLVYDLARFPPGTECGRGRSCDSSESSLEGGFSNSQDADPASARDLYKNLIELAGLDTDMKDHLLTIYRICKTKELRCVVELGVRSGISTQAFLAAIDEIEDACLFSFDIQPLSRLFGEADLMERIPAAVGYPKWKMEIRDSIEAGKAWQDPVDILFFDTEHTEQQLRTELEVWKKHLKPDSVLLFHDTAVPGVLQAILKFSARSRYKKFVNRPRSHGFGILYDENAIHLPL